MSYRYRIKSISELRQTPTQTVLSGELLEGEIPDGIHFSYVQVGDRRVDLQVARAMVLVKYRPDVPEKQKSSFIRVINPPLDCALLKHLILANDDPYVPKPERKCTPAELEKSFEEGRQYLAEALKDFKVPD
jgi:hypothetical protein